MWDGASSDVRRSFPTKTTQLRTIQYDSCRGLEGWTVVCLQLDAFYDYVLNDYTPTPAEEDDLFFDRETAATQYARQWMMIPVTRAMSTLVLHVKDPKHPIGEALARVAEQLGASVELVSL